MQLVLMFVTVILAAMAVPGSGRHAFLGAEHNITTSSLDGSTTQPLTFASWCDSHRVGRGIWKWRHILESYQSHLGAFIGRPAKLLDVGVGSGGSVRMWHDVLGALVRVYAMDIDPRCQSFADEGFSTRPFVGDQGQLATWTHFFSDVTRDLDIAIDDGGHHAFQMNTFVTEVFPRLNPGGVLAVEDIRSNTENYLNTFFWPVADWLGSQVMLLETVHLYPYLLLLQRTGGTGFVAPQPAATYHGLTELLLALPQHLGQVVALVAPVGDSLLTSVSLRFIFSAFYELYAGEMVDTPTSCRDLCNTPCTTLPRILNTKQKMVSAVHITAQALYVKVEATPPDMEAVRRGDKWLEGTCKIDVPSGLR